MKKFILISLSILILIITAIYIFIPNQLSVSLTQEVSVSAPEVVATKYLSQSKNWEKWWPGQSRNDSLFSFNDYDYYPQKGTLISADILISEDNEKMNSQMSFFASGKNTLLVNWKATIPTGINPIEKISKYRQAKELKANMAIILRRLDTFLEQSRNIYGIKIKYTKVKDSLVLSTRKITAAYPKTSEVYDAIKSLRQYISSNAVMEKGYPMLNVTQLGNKSYQMMVAIPINKRLPTKGDIVTNTMVLGNLLSTEVKGGPNTVENALNSMHNYIRDYRHTSPAIPFEVLVTNRIAEPDTSKWITRIYYPIF